MKSRFILVAISTFFLTTSISFGYKATFLPRLSVQGQYDDNIFLTQDKDLKEDDFITTITPGFTAEILGKNNGAKISYDAAYAMYNEYDEFNGWRHRANLSGWSQLTKYTGLKIRDNFLYTEDPIRNENIAEIRTEDPTLPIDSTTIKTRRTYYQNFAGVDLNHQFGKYNSSFGIGYSYFFRNEDDREDRQIHTPSVGVTYWISPQWGFGFNGNYQHAEYEISDNFDLFSGSVSFLKRFGKHFTGFIRYSQTVADYKGESEDDITYIPSIGFKYDIEKDITLITDVGYFYNDYEVRQSESGVSGDIRLIKKFERGKLNFAALGGSDYSLYDSDNNNNGFSVFYEASVSGTYQFAKHFGGNIFGSYRNTDYIDADRKDKRPTVGCGLSWKALEWMNLGLNYRFQKVDSTRDANDYDDNRVSVRITVFPTVPFHTSRY